MIEKRFYTCQYCYIEFEPKRRRVQKYCSNSCRSKAYHARKAHTDNSNNKSLSLSNNNIKVPDTVPQIEKMSMAGIGNATAGSLLADSLKAVLTSKHNKPATKGDINTLLERLGSRYLLVNNLPPNALGQYPYYDVIEGEVVYLTISKNN